MAYEANLTLMQGYLNPERIKKIKDYFKDIEAVSFTGSGQGESIGGVPQVEGSYNNDVYFIPTMNSVANLFLRKSHYLEDTKATMKIASGKQEDLDILVNHILELNCID